MRTPANPPEAMGGGAPSAHMAQPADPDEPLPVIHWARHWPGRRGRTPLHVSVVYRWIKDGQDGVRLRAQRIPGAGTCCTERDVAEFVAAVAAARAGGGTEPSRSGPKPPRPHAALARHGLARLEEEAQP